jgi:hypothetical protein
MMTCWIVRLYCPMTGVLLLPDELRWRCLDGGDPMKDMDWVNPMVLTWDGEETIFFSPEYGCFIPSSLSEKINFSDCLVVIEKVSQ